MSRSGIIRKRNLGPRRFAPLVVTLVLLANLLSSFAPLSPMMAQAAGLDDSNSIVICTDGGFRRVSFEELGISGPEEAPAGHCAEYCSLCVIALSAQVVLTADFTFALHSQDRATRMSIRTSDSILAATAPVRNRPRAPPSLS